MSGDRECTTKLGKLNEAIVITAHTQIENDTQSEWIEYFNVSYRKKNNNKNRVSLAFWKSDII